MKDMQDKEKGAQRMEYIRRAQRGISDAQEEAEKDVVENYNGQFKDQAQSDVIVLAEVAVEDLNEENANLLNEQERRAVEEHKQYELHCRELRNMQEESKAELYHRSELLHKQLLRNELDSISRTLTREARIRGAFKITGKKMTNDLEHAKGEISTQYRGVALEDKALRHNLGARGVQGEDSSESFYKQQLVEVRVEILRCVKDKLPKGRYVILCSILDRLGGNVLEYLSARSRNGRRITAPKPHNGEYHLNNLRFEESLLLIAPSRFNLLPSMAYLFELFLLKSKEYSHDQVLGWGVFPLINADFELNQGKYKVSECECKE